MPLYVRVVEAWHPHLGKGRCYCAVEVSGQRRRTVDVSRTTRPFFDETFRFDAVANEPRGVRVLVKLQRRYIFSDECMGAIEVPFAPDANAYAIVVASASTSASASAATSTSTDLSSANTVGWYRLQPFRSQRRAMGQVRVLLSANPSVSAQPVDVGGPVPLIGVADAEAEARRAGEARSDGEGAGDNEDESKGVDSRVRQKLQAVGGDGGAAGGSPASSPGAGATTQHAPQNAPSSPASPTSGASPSSAPALRRRQRKQSCCDGSAQQVSSREVAEAILVLDDRRLRRIGALARASAENGTRARARATELANAPACPCRCLADRSG